MRKKTAAADYRPGAFQTAAVSMPECENACRIAKYSQFQRDLHDFWHVLLESARLPKADAVTGGSCREKRVAKESKRAHPRVFRR
jgi:hypothetical protein